MSEPGPGSRLIRMGWKIHCPSDQSCRVQIQSRSHTVLELFSIQPQGSLWRVDVLQKQLSLYCNGQRCGAGSLQPGDWLHLGRLDFVFLGSWLLASAKLPGFTALEEGPADLPERPADDQEDIPVREADACSAGAKTGGFGATILLDENNQPVSLPQSAPLRRSESFPPLSSRQAVVWSAGHLTSGNAGSQEPLDFSSLETVILQAEAPAILQPAAPPHWFSSLGPACMIVASSVVSAGIGWMKNPAGWSEVLAGMSSSLSMAAAFVGFGLINRSITKKSARIPQERNRKLYEAALRDWSGRLDHALEKAQSRYARQTARLQHWDRQLAGPAPSPWCLPIGFGQMKAARVELPPIRYDQKEDGLIQRLEQLGRKHLQAACWKCLEQGQICQIQGWDTHWIDGLFGLWCWMLYGENRRFVYIGSAWNPPAAHPGICLDHQLLCFDHLAQFLQVARFHSGMEWFVVIEQAEPTELPQSSWVVLAGTEPAAWPAGPLPALDLGVLRESALHGWRPKTPSVEPLSDSGLDMALLRQNAANLKVDLDGDGKNILDFASMGPHMLAAGTTGSGKSEGMTHILLALTLHNSSRYLQYILIDFKGGAFGSVFYEFPHMAGSLTNMEAGSIQRLEQALDRELEHRQKRIAAMMEQFPFAGTDVAAYNTCFPEDPLSELFIIVDEYAQLKQECPAFLQKLQESARIGRSLGIHLILATQKPAGVVDGQTFANSRIRLCFMVQSSADSREVLGHERASSLSKPGEYICEISGQCSLQGQMVYTRAPAGIQETIRIERGGQILYESPPSLSILEKASALILQAQEERRWILCPDLPTVLQSRTGLIQDAITHLEPCPLQPGEPVWLQGPKEILPQAAAIACLSWKGPVYTAGFALDEADGQIPPMALWQCCAWKEELLLVNEEALSVSVCRRLLERARCAVLVCSSQPLNRKESLLSLCPVRLGSSLKDKEQQYLLFGRGSDAIPDWPLVHGHAKGRHFRGAFCLGKTPPARAKHPMPEWICNPMRWQAALKMPAGLLGFESEYGDPVYWDPTKPLLIAYAQPHLRQPIEQLVLLWHQQDPAITSGSLLENAPVALIQLPDEAPLLQKPAGIQALYTRQVCFAGPGLRDHQYTLKLPSAPMGQGNGVLFGKEIVWLQLLEIPCAST